MATNHTEHYNLNLWEPSDKFVRAEFNENTQKLETALLSKTDAETTAALQTQVTTLATQTDTRLKALDAKSIFTPLFSSQLGADAVCFDVDVSDIDWSKWEIVVAKLALTSSGSQYGTIAAITTEGYAASATFDTLSALSSFGGLGRLYFPEPNARAHTTVFLLSGREPDSLATAVCCGGRVLSCGYAQSLAFSQMHKLRFQAAEGDVLKAGSSVEFFGVK